MAQETVPEQTTEACPNCGTTRPGEFCQQCGQRAVELDTPLKTFLAEAAGSLFALDSRLWSTLRPLFRHPGALTLSYINGQRARYVPPLRLYLFVSFVAFLVLGLIWRFDSDSANTNVRLNLNDAQVTSATATQEQIDEIRESAKTAPPPARFLVERVALPLLTDRQATTTQLSRRLPVAILLTLPIFAALTRLLYRKQQRYYVPHLVFALHFFAFALLVSALGSLGDAVTGTEVPGSGTTLWVIGYLFLALRRVFGGSRKKTLLKWILLLAGFAPVLMLGTVSAMALAAISTSG